ncbi:purine-binding chemotaxis protein CheW [Lysobacter sp. SG-8]|uniref:Purine-binding chemotaxis protein CheW n=1 Tax=Marilutibacter penaei TaxID=2759900 RepID=A0A7W3YEU8_9GAMM|nr:chemotaxis protein CheW [Lysobacter penaei]MBB1088502.1 purine-binding chemotaxis protein CheW [Lysobacter penaei]
MTPFEVLVDYEQRSLAHVIGLPEQIDAPGLWRGVGYRIGSHRLASAFDEVVEILTLPALTPVPGAQPWMLGLANVRGNLMPVVDLKQFMQAERTVLHEGQRMLLVRQGGGNVAVLIDELHGQRSFLEEHLLDVDDLEVPEDDMAAWVEGRYRHLTDRYYRLEGALWRVFSLDRLTRTPEFRQAASDIARPDLGARNTLEVES